ncbi:MULTISPECIES: CRISPR-associated endonuclease Cas2 [Staphylococcus]|uniref:CRISPR-associated endoribonuclease Cas2 n=1 Tax=Staphylococcus lugdunensis TaxID=28035 RepID=A0ABX6BT58_STALU|nr:MULTISPECIES: CRISPR-associated endonuclease Cas2 [Staphylococcus]ADC86175.1 CRISPR-associated protein Cas2 [Staphylococcus lugdunensis HKU09-01]ARJ07962.1 CRISPR-associated endonuclease Cas2 [Staphylococcus lugdunensis]ARJ15053.1 CRISPR-associated endonuclease Cas2 [Staphylococcus lugdunensis]ARJ28438.1 CRISPR-associated endonuclease Cas2 [Staphylococcus lugdunensis]EKS22899.1 CRISPR-associated endoribonuclease cas2 [Staphylococcus lugdunensis ACS-027-V-Sch2]
MFLLISFDLPRDTKYERKIANKYRLRLLELGFSMKQFSLYERYTSDTQKKDKILSILKEEMPNTGKITMYVLPDEVNNKQITILGKEAKIINYKEPKLIFI